jgi:hypothetical protein
MLPHASVARGDPGAGGVTPITFVTFKWKPQQPGYRSTFGPEQVNTLFRMIDRHYPHPHRNVCVTDDVKGIDPSIERITLWDDYKDLPNPNGRHNPSCYRRLKLFAPNAGDVFGERLVVFDLDMVIVGDLTPLFAGGEDFKIWGQSDYPKTQWYNGSLWMLKTGSRPTVWTKFNHRQSPRLTLKAGKKGSDQGWFSYILGPKEAIWGTQDGVYSYRVHLSKLAWQLPENAKVIAFHGKTDPWGYVAQQHSWVREHYQ